MLIWLGKQFLGQRDQEKEPRQIEILSNSTLTRLEKEEFYNRKLELDQIIQLQDEEGSKKRMDNGKKEQTREIEKVFKIIQPEFELYEFVKQAWPYIEGGKEFTPGWHIEAICEHLEAVYRRDIKNLLINIPPRCSKSTIISIAFPAWVWLQNAGEQFMYASYARDIALDHSVACRRLIQSYWYQAHWGHYFDLIYDQNTKNKFDNTKRGYRIATSVGALATGRGGSMLVCDDPNSADDGFSKAAREAKINWWNQNWSTRLNDPKNDCRIVVQQRIHERDVSGYIIANDDLNEWTKLILPMEFEKSRRSRTVALHTTAGEIWEDLREEEGELLWPQRIGQPELKKLKQRLGSEYAISGQLQQRPSPQAGGIIKREWFKWWKQNTWPRFDYIIQSWDTAISDKDTAAYSACTTWGIFEDEYQIANVMLLSMWRDHVDFPGLLKRAERLYNNYKDTAKGKTSIVGSSGRSPDVCIVEAKATGFPLIRALRSFKIKATEYHPRGDKEGRVSMISHLIEGGLVWLPAQSPSFERLLPYADEFLESVCMFPNAESRDLVDTMSQALHRLKDAHIINHPKSEKWDDAPTPPKKLY